MVNNSFYARDRHQGQHVLTDAESIAFWQGCEKFRYSYRQMFRRLLLTGQRKVEVFEGGDFVFTAKNKD